MIPPAKIIAPDDESWYVARVRGRTEEDFRDRMGAAGVTVRLVMRKIDRIVPRSDRPGNARTYRHNVPAFPGYVFIFGLPELIDVAYSAPLPRFRPYSIRPVNCTSKFLRQLDAAEDRFAREPTEVTKRFIQGERFTVRGDCPIKSLRGLTLVVENGSGTPYLRLDEVGSSLALDVSPAYLEPA